MAQHGPSGPAVGSFMGDSLTVRSPALGKLHEFSDRPRAALVRSALIELRSLRIVARSMLNELRSLRIVARSVLNELRSLRIVARSAAIVISSGPIVARSAAIERRFSDRGSECLTSRSRSPSSHRIITTSVTAPPTTSARTPTMSGSTHPGLSMNAVGNPHGTSPSGEAPSGGSFAAANA